MEKKLLTYPHDISKKLLIILGISKIAIGLSILFVFITNLIIYTNSELIFWMGYTLLDTNYVDKWTN